MLAATAVDDHCPRRQGLEGFGAENPPGRRGQRQQVDQQIETFEKAAESQVATVAVHAGYILATACPAADAVAGISQVVGNRCAQ
ncbi:hypothetical protein D3C76_1707630 [compost metagenome]